MQKCNCNAPPNQSSARHSSWCNVSMGKRGLTQVGSNEYKKEVPTIKPVAAAVGGLKFDGGKPRMELLILGCPRALEGVADVLTFGANKYAAHSWREVEDGINRYIAANHRHWIEIGKHGLDSRDEESGKLHIDHVNTNGLFISELIRAHYGITD